jgi:tetratricopeptide (TPR) repeat protein
VQRISSLAQQYPQNAGLQLLLAVSYFDLKDLEKSESSVRRAIALDPRTPGALTLLGNIDMARGAAEAAKADWRKAIAAYPQTLSNYVALGAQYEKEGQWDEAKQIFKKANEIDPASPLVAAELAFLNLEHGGDVNAAVALAQTAKQKMPDSPITADALGWAYYKSGSADLAIRQLKESTEKDPHNPIYRYHLGMAYIAANRPDLAGRSLQSALKEDPNFPYAPNAREALARLSQKAQPAGR